MMKTWLLLVFALAIHLDFIGSEAKEEKQSNTDNAVLLINSEGKVVKETLDGPVWEVATQKGGTAILPCKFNEPRAGIVTWVRRKDRHLLTVGGTTHTVDKRFMIRANLDPSLVIRRVTLEDAGLYECQIATYPVQQSFVQLRVTKAYSVIPGAPDFYVKQGSSLRLECKLKASTEPPNFVFWYQQGRMINYDADPLVQVELTKNGSMLKVEKTQISHGGNYTCAPSNADSSSVMIHVIEEEEKSAAMHGGERRNSSSPTVETNFLIWFFIFTYSWTILNFSNLYPT